MTSRVLIIGLDGATWSVVGPFADGGHLPNLAALKARGCWGELRSTIPPLSAPAWSTFLTGKSPAHHGVFHFVDWGDQSGEGGGPGSRLVNGASIESPTMWDVAAHHGRNVGVINVPMSYPPRPVNGFMITGLLTPPDAEVFTYPPELSAELPDYEIDLDRFISAKPFAAEEGQDKAKRVVKPDLELVAEFHKMETQRGKTALSLMRTRPWDVFTVVFTGTDRMGHYLWQYHRKADLDGSSMSEALHTAIRGVYSSIDNAIGELVAEAGDDTTVLVLSDHGMGPIYDRNTHWNKWLFDRGYVALEDSGKKTVDGWLLRLGLPRDTLRKVAAKVPGVMTSKPMKALKKAPTAKIDTLASKAYYERWFDPVGGIRINAEGAERERIRAELMEALVAVVDPDTGEPIVKEAWRREDCLSGPYVERAPDIVIIMNPAYGSSDRMSSYSSIVTPRPNISDPGGHQMEGIFMAAGPGVGHSPHPCAGMTIEDVAPTVLHLLGLGVPEDMDGRVLSELFAPGGPADRPVEPAPPMAWWPNEEKARASGRDDVAADEDAVRERLRALGYFE